MVVFVCQEVPLMQSSDGWRSSTVNPFPQVPPHPLQKQQLPYPGPCQIIDEHRQHLRARVPLPHPTSLQCPQHPLPPYTLASSRPVKKRSRLFRHYQIYLDSRIKNTQDKNRCTATLMPWALHSHCFHLRHQPLLEVLLLHLCDPPG